MKGMNDGGLIKSKRTASTGERAQFMEYLPYKHWERAQPMEYLPCKQEHLDLVPLNFVEKPGMVACSSHALVISVLRRQRWADLWGSLASKSGLLVKFQTSEKPCLKTITHKLGDMAQPAKCLSHKNEGLSLDLSHLYRSQAYWGMSKTLVANGEFQV